MGNINKNSFKPLLSLILTLSLLTSCQKTPQEQVSCNNPLTPVANASENTNNPLDISVNIDGSDSMVGYITNSNNNYTTAMELLANAVIGSDNVAVEYKRIGDDKILSRDNIRKDAITKTFYHGNDNIYKPVSSPIHSAITPPIKGRDKLTIIVTDLEGDDGGKIAEVLAQNYLNNDLQNEDYTVGIWAIKSQFNGMIYNPNTGKAKFNYNTEGKDQEKFRPFYVLFIGKYDHIVQYFDELKKLDTNIHNDSKMFIFPTLRIFAQNPINLGGLVERENNAKLPDDQQLERVFALEDDNVIVEVIDANNESYELLNIAHQDQPTATINYQVSFPDLTKIEGGNYLLPIDQKNLVTDMKVYTFNPNAQDKQITESTSKESEIKEEKQDNNQEKQQEKEPELIENKSPEKQFFTLNNNNSLKQGLVIKDLKLNQEKEILQFNTDINLNSLPNPQIYLFEANLVLKDLNSPDWWNDWSGNSQGNDGSKTQNLSIFMNKLKSLNLKTLAKGNDQPTIGNFCFGVQKNN